MRRRPRRAFSAPSCKCAEPVAFSSLKTIGLQIVFSDLTTTDALQLSVSWSQVERRKNIAQSIMRILHTEASAFSVDKRHSPILSPTLLLRTS